jgi:hypothetical protein
MTLKNGLKKLITLVKPLQDCWDRYPDIPSSDVDIDSIAAGKIS